MKTIMLRCVLADGSFSTARRHHHPALDELQKRRGDRQEADAEREAQDRQVEEDLLLAHVDAADDGVDAGQSLVQHAVDEVGGVGAGDRHDLQAEDREHRARVEVGQADRG